MSDPDQESYSIDEMLGRLRSRNRGPSDGEPELVTRADGTQAIKVRRRKRRSHQPHKEAEKKRRKRNLILASAVIGLVVVLVLGVAGWIFYLNSGSYQEGVERRIEAWTGADVEVTRFRSTPVSVAAERIQATWPDDSPAARLQLSQIRGDLRMSSHLGGAWSGQAIRATSGDLTLRVAPAASGVGHELPEGPNPFQVPVEVGALTVRFGEGEQPVLHLGGARASFRVPNPESRAGSLVLEDGRFRLGSWGAFELEFASLHLAPEGVRVGNLRFHPEAAPKARIHLSGQDRPEILVRGGGNELKMELQDLPSVSLLGSGLGRLIDARFESTDGDSGGGTCDFDVTDLSSVRLEVPVQVVLGTALYLHDLPCFELLAEELGNPKLARPGFETTARTVVQREEESCRLKSLNLVSRDDLEVSGSIEESKGRLGGELEIGLSDAVLNVSPRLMAVFKRSSSGMRWATVRLSGTVRQPADDFAAQLAEAQVEIAPAEGGAQDLEDEFLDLTTPPGSR